MTWLHKLRTRYWEIRSEGARFKLLREAKNRDPEHKGKYTLDAVALRTNILASTIRKFESGGMDLNDRLLVELLKGLEITETEFRSAPKMDETFMGGPVTPVTSSQTAPEKRKRRTRAEMEALRAGQTPQVAPKATLNPPTPHTTGAALAQPTAKPAQLSVTTGAITHITNNTTLTLVIKIENGVLFIFDDSHENLKKGHWVPPADVKGGAITVPRTIKL